MKDMGADATVAELDQIINYLTTNFGKDAPKKDAQAASTAQTAKVNVNKASAKEIAGLGFSDKEAGLIVDYRTKNGNIKDADALAKIDGVDPAKVQAAKDKMEF
jgi:competence ComEA-like helix-hairpin-helix protein